MEKYETSIEQLKEKIPGLNRVLLEGDYVCVGIYLKELLKFNQNYRSFLDIEDKITFLGGVSEEAGYMKNWLFSIYSEGYSQLKKKTKKRIRKAISLINLVIEGSKEEIERLTKSQAATTA